MEDEKVNLTDEFVLFEKGKNFLTLRNYYNRTQKDIDFYQDRQWNGAELGDFPALSHNFIKPIVDYKTSVLDTYDYQIIFNSNNYESDEQIAQMEEICKKLNSHVAVIWEMLKIDKKVKEMKNLAAITGEGCLFFRFEEVKKDKNKEDTSLDANVIKGEIQADKILTTDIYYANENSQDIQSQPYIIIKQRRNLLDVKTEARNLGLPEEEIARISSDREVSTEINDNAKNEVNDAVIVLTKFWKENGTVHYSKATRQVQLVENEDLKTERYPIVHYTWKEDIGSSRGLGEVERLIPNQIETNRTLMRRAMIIKMIAYPKPVANTSFIKNPQAIKQVGATIELTGAVDNISNYFGYVQPTQTSGEAAVLQEELISKSRELANASDVATGSVNPEKASGRSILAVQQASQQPLSEQLNRFKDTLEDIGLIIYDLWKAYNTNGMKVYSKQEKDNLKQIDDGKRKYNLEEITAEQLDKLKPYIKIDITPKSSYDLFAQEQSFENLLVKGLISFEEYVELLGPESSMNKAALTKLIQKRQAKQEEIRKMQKQLNTAKSQMQNEMQTELVANQVNQNAETQSQEDLINALAAGQGGE